MKSNWILELSVVTLLVIQRNPKDTGFIVQTIVLELLKQAMLDSLRMVKLVGVLINKLWILMK